MTMSQGPDVSNTQSLTTGQWTAEVKLPANCVPGHTPQKSAKATRRNINVWRTTDNPTKAINEAHTALHKGCPSLQAVLERNRQNTEY